MTVYWWQYTLPHEYNYIFHLSYTQHAKELLAAGQALTVTRKPGWSMLVQLFWQVIGRFWTCSASVVICFEKFWLQKLKNCQIGSYLDCLGLSQHPSCVTLWWRIVWSKSSNGWSGRFLNTKPNAQDHINNSMTSGPGLLAPELLLTLVACFNLLATLRWKGFVPYCVTSRTADNTFSIMQALPSFTFWFVVYCPHYDLIVWPTCRTKSSATASAATSEKFLTAGMGVRHPRAKAVTSQAAARVMDGPTAARAPAIRSGSARSEGCMESNKREKGQKERIQCDTTFPKPLLNQNILRVWAPARTVASWMNVWLVWKNQFFQIVLPPAWLGEIMAVQDWTTEVQSHCKGQNQGTPNRLVDREDFIFQKRTSDKQQVPPFKPGTFMSDWQKMLFKSRFAPWLRC